MKIFLAGPTNLEMLEDLIGRKVGVKVHSFPLTAELVRGYMAAGHDVRIGVFSQELNQKQMLIESDCLSIAIVRSRRARESLIDWFGREVKGMSDAIVEWQPDIVHAHWTYEYARAAIRSGFPSVITAHDVPSSLFSLMRPRYYWWPKLLQGFIVSRRSRMMTGQSPYTVEGWKRGMKRIRPMALVPNGVSSSLLQLREDRHPINQLEPKRRGLTTRQGLPAATTLAGILAETMLPAPMTDPEPILTPFITIEPVPMKTSSSITTSFLIAKSVPMYLRGTASTGWKSVSNIVTLAPSRHLLPMSTAAEAQMTPPLIPVSAPITILASCERVRRIVARFTPSAVSLELLMILTLSPNSIEDPGYTVTIGRPRRLMDLEATTPGIPQMSIR